MVNEQNHCAYINVKILLGYICKGEENMSASEYDVENDQQV